MLVTAGQGREPDRRDELGGEAVGCRAAGGGQAERRCSSSAARRRPRRPEGTPASGGSTERAVTECSDRALRRRGRPRARPRPSPPARCRRRPPRDRRSRTPQHGACSAARSPVMPSRCNPRLGEPQTPDLALHRLDRGLARIGALGDGDRQVAGANEIRAQHVVRLHDPARSSRRSRCRPPKRGAVRAA